MLQMEDESGQDEKIICVPHDKIHPMYKTVQKVEDLPEIQRQAIEHFFTRYKDLEPGKWVKVTGWADRAAAEAVIEKAIAAAK
jgi:inorganic pyrophosphatase